MNNFTALGNYQSGYLNRVLGKGGAEATAKRIAHMLTRQEVYHSKKGFPVNLGAGSITFSKYRIELYRFLEKDTMTVPEMTELVKRLLQQLEVYTYSNLSEEVQNEVIKDFEK